MGAHARSSEAPSRLPVRVLGMVADSELHMAGMMGHSNIDAVHLFEALTCMWLLPHQAE